MTLAQFAEELDLDPNAGIPLSVRLAHATATRLDDLRDVLSDVLQQLKKIDNNTEPVR